MQQLLVTAFSQFSTRQQDSLSTILLGQVKSFYKIIWRHCINEVIKWLNYTSIQILKLLDLKCLDMDFSS